LNAIAGSGAKRPQNDLKAVCDSI